MKPGQLKVILLFKKALYKVKASGQHLTLYFGRPLLRHTIKINFITFQTDDPEICSILIFH